MTSSTKPIQPTHKPLPELGSDAPDWMHLLHADVAHTGSISATARRVGVDRSALSGLLNQTDSSPYVNGKSSTASLAAKVRATIGLLECPFLSQEYGEARKLSGLECRGFACIPTPPTQSPRAMQHWRACQGCRHKPQHPAQPVASGAPQQAGIIDKFTLPLPVVGGPQIATEQEPA